MNRCCWVGLFLFGMAAAAPPVWADHVDGKIVSTQLFLNPGKWDNSWGYFVLRDSKYQYKFVWILKKAPADGSLAAVEKDDLSLLFSFFPLRTVGSFWNVSADGSNSFYIHSQTTFCKSDWSW